MTISQWFDSTVALATRIGPLLALVSTVLATVGALTAYRNASISQRSFQTANRAFIYLKDFQPGIVVEGTGPEQSVVGWQVAPRWVNNGATDTKRALAHFSASPFPSGLPDNFDFPDIPNTITHRVESNVYFGPKSEVLGAPIRIPVESLLQAHEHKTRIYLWGWVEYDDIFGFGHRSEFFHELNVLGDPRVANSQHLVFEIQDRHNQSVDERLH